MNDNKKDVDDNVRQCAVLLRDIEVQAQFQEYYYDSTSPIPPNDGIKDAAYKESTSVQTIKETLPKKDTNYASPDAIDITM